MKIVLKILLWQIGLVDEVAETREEVKHNFTLFGDWQSCKDAFVKKIAGKKSCNQVLESATNIATKLAAIPGEVSHILRFNCETSKKTHMHESATIVRKTTHLHEFAPIFTPSDHQAH